MGLFTEIGAALSFNFGGTKESDLTAEEKAFYRKRFGGDRTEEEEHLFEFIKQKYGVVSSRIIETHIKAIDKYTDDYNNVPFDEIMRNEPLIDREYLIIARDAIIEYLDTYYTDDENILIKSKDKTETKISLEKEAIQDIQNLLELLRKKKTGQFGEQEKRILEENKEKYKKDIAILRDYMEKGAFGEQEKCILEENVERWNEDIVILRTYMEQETGGK